MSAPSFKPYQSRLFNFINRQSLRLREKISLSGRHLKVAIEWGVQILIYPIYLLVQTGRMADKRLGQTLKKSRLLPFVGKSEGEGETITPEENTPIKQIFKTVEPWITQGNGEFSLSPISPSKNLPTQNHGQTQFILNAPTSDMQQNLATQTEKQAAISDGGNLTVTPITIRGIATDLESRNLVLINDSNQSLNILTQEQQELLKRRIYWELANYQYQLRLQKEAQKKYPGLVPHFQTNSPTILPPVRWFWMVIRWMQTGQIAQGINLFGELELINLPVNKSNVHRHNSFWLDFPDYPQFATGLLAPTQHKYVSKFSPTLNTDTDDVSDLIYLNHEQDPFQVLILIQAAIAHFFGKQDKNTAIKANNNLLLNASSNTSQEPDPWLLWEDIYPESISKNKSAQPIDSSLVQPLALPTVAQNPSKPSQSISERIKGKLKKNNQPKEIIKTKQPIKTLSKSEATPKTIVGAEQNHQTCSTELNNQVESDFSDISVFKEKQQNSNPILFSDQVNQPGTAFDWVETDATPVGYVKHPLERILGWLDASIVWLENLLLMLWNWLKNI